MSEKKPIPIIDSSGIKICPVCGKRSYSRDGVHPQCSVNKADAVRRKILAARKKANLDNK
jgi:hypothetical protein